MINEMCQRAEIEQYVDFEFAHASQIIEMCFNEHANYCIRWIVFFSLYLLLM